MKKIEADVLLNNKDMSKFLIRHTYARFGGVFGVILSLGAIVGLVVFWSNLIPMQRWILAALGLMFTVIQPLMLWGKGKRQLKQDIFQKPFHYEFGEEKVNVTQGEYKESFSYRDIRKVITTKEALYIYLSSVSAFILPLHCFVPDTYLALAKQLKEKTKRK